MRMWNVGVRNVGVGIVGVGIVGVGIVGVGNVGVLPHDRLLAMYRASGALIYPSSFESFGLPLIEARQAGLPVLAPELDYVRDVIDPDETFDPRSPISIARAVRRYLEGSTQATEPRGAEALLDHMLARKAS